MSYLIKAIKKLKPSSEFSLNNDDYSTIKWDILEGNAPTKKEIDDVIENIKNNEINEAQAKIIARQAILERLGITEEEAKLLLG